MLPDRTTKVFSIKFAETDRIWNLFCDVKPALYFFHFSISLALV